MATIEISLILYRQDSFREVIWILASDTIHTIIPVVVAGEDLVDDREIYDAIDKSQIKQNVLAGRFAMANEDDIKRAVEVARDDVDGWRSLSHEQRHEALKAVAIKVRERRDDLIGIAAAEVGKVFTETDVEVSEAIDFIEFYSHAVRHFDDYENLDKYVGYEVGQWC